MLWFFSLGAGAIRKKATIVGESAHDSASVV